MGKLSGTGLMAFGLCINNQKNRCRKMTHKRLRRKNENRLNVVSRSWQPLLFSLKRNLKYGASLGGLLTDK